VFYLGNHSHIGTINLNHKRQRSNYGKFRMVDFKLQYFAVFITPNECPSSIQTSKTTQVFVLSTWYDHNMHRQNIIGWLEVWLLPTDTYNDRVCMMAIFTTGISDWSFYAHLQNCEKQLLALSFNW